MEKVPTLQLSELVSFFFSSIYRRWRRKANASQQSIRWVIHDQILCHLVERKCSDQFLYVVTAATVYESIIFGQSYACRCRGIDGKWYLVRGCYFPLRTFIFYSFTCSLVLYSIWQETSAQWSSVATVSSSSSKSSGRNRSYSHTLTEWVLINSFSNT